MITHCSVQGLEITQLHTNQLKRLVGNKLSEKRKISPNSSTFPQDRQHRSWKCPGQGRSALYDMAEMEFVCESQI